MGQIMTIGVVLFIAAMIFVGYKKGLIKMAFSIASVIIVLVLVQLLSPMAKDLIVKTPIYDEVSQQMSGYIEKNVTEASKGITQAGVTAQENVINNLPLPKSAKESLIKNNTSDGYESLGVSGFSEYISAFLINMILNAATFVILFILLTILIRVLMHMLDLIAHLPGINFLNRVGGAVLGMVEAVIVLWIACIILTMFSATEWGQSACEAINGNILLSLIYDNNWIQNILSGMFSI